MKFNNGKLYAVKFYDHALNSDAIECICSGILIRQTKKTITLAYWLPVDKDIELVKNNWEIVSIIKSTITSFKEFNFN